MDTVSQGEAGTADHGTVPSNPPEKKIFLVHDDVEILDSLIDALPPNFYDLRSFSHSSQVLDEIRAEKPTIDLVIADISACRSDEKTFCEYVWELAERNIPFLIVSPRGTDPSLELHVQPGLEDFVYYPISPSFFSAKVRTVLSRSTKRISVAQSQLEDVGLIDLLQICEQSRVTGTITIIGERGEGLVEIHRGEPSRVVYEALNDNDALNELLSWKAGAVIIHQELLSLDNVRKAEPAADDTAEEQPQRTPQIEGTQARYFGLVSRKVISDKDVTIQTELLTHPEKKIVTVISVDGHIKKKIKKSLDKDLTPRQIGERIKEAHAKVVREIEEKATLVATTKNGEDPSEPPSKSKEAEVMDIPESTQPESEKNHIPQELRAEPGPQPQQKQSSTAREVRMVNVKMLNNAVLALHEALGEGLIATDIFSSADGQSIAGYNSNARACALFNRVTGYLIDALERSGFPALNRYYMLDLTDEKLVIVAPFGKYQWGMLVDRNKTQVGLIINVILPDLLDSVREALEE